MAQHSSPGAGNARKGEPLSKRSYTLRLTFSSLMTAAIVLIIGIGWSFVLGVMVGRGYNPEKQIPQLSSFLPKEEELSPNAVSKVGDDQPKGQIMRAEDLSYAASLKGKPGQGKLAPPVPKSGTEARPKNMQNATAMVASTQIPPAATGTAPAGQLVTQGSLDATSATGGVVQAAPTTAPPAVSANQPNFDFTFQVATFKENESVDKLRARLEGEGFRTRMDKIQGKNVLLRVMVLYRGTNEGAQSLRQRLVDMGLGQPIQRGKNPVGGKAKKS